MVAASEDAVNQATHEEVARTGIKLEDSRQLELPEKTRSKNAGATSLQTPAAPQTEQQPAEHQAPQRPATEQPVEEQQQSVAENAPSPDDEVPAQKSLTPEQQEALSELNPHHKVAKKAHPAASAHHYTLQIGSYSNMNEAQARVKDLEISGLTPRIHATDLKGKGRWYRIYLGGFATKAAAEKAGKKYRAQGMIDSFIVAKSVE
jgi:cell division protein FtsN